MLSVALHHLGGIYRNARVVAVFGDTEVRPLPERWLPWLGGMVIHWVSPAEFQQKGYSAQGDARWLHIPENCDFVIFMDADAMLLCQIDDLLTELIASPAVAGVIAHLPFPQLPDQTPVQKWGSLARQFIGRDLLLEYTHAFANDDTPLSHRHCPFYLNFGFVIISSDLAKQLRSTYLEIRPRVASYLQTHIFSAQVALTLAVYANHVSRKAISIKYNFPNDVIAETLYPDALRDIRVIHYLRTHHFDRQRIFAKREEFDQFLELDLLGSEKIFQNHIRLITKSQYPFDGVPGSVDSC
jgi:hypothetical protein